MSNIMLTILWLALATASSASVSHPAITTTPYHAPVPNIRQPTPSALDQVTPDTLRSVISADKHPLPTPSASPKYEHIPKPSAIIPPMPHSRREVTQAQTNDFTPTPSASVRPAEESDVPMVDVPIPIPPYHTQIAMRDLNQIPAYTPPAPMASPIIISPYTPMASPYATPFYYSQRKYGRPTAATLTPTPSASSVAAETGAGTAVTSPIIISPYTPPVFPHVTPLYYSQRKYGRPTTTTPTPSASSVAAETGPGIAITSPIIVSPYTPLAFPHVTPLYYSQRKYSSPAETTTATPTASHMVIATGTPYASFSPKAMYTSEFTSIPLPVPSHSGFPAMRSLTKRVIFRPLDMPRRNPLPAHIYAYDRTARLIRTETGASTPSPTSAPSLHFIDFGAVRSFAPLPSTGFITFGDRLADTAATPQDQPGVSINSKEPSPSPTYTPYIYQLGRRVFEPSISASAMPTIVPVVSPKPHGTWEPQPAITAQVRFEKVVRTTMLVMPSMSPMRTSDISWFTDDAQRRAADTRQFIQSAVRHRTVKQPTLTPTPTRSRTSSGIETGTIQTDRSYSESDSDWSKPTRMTPFATPSITPKYDARAYEVRQAHYVRSDRVTPSPSPTPRHKQLNDVYGRNVAMPVASNGIYPLPQYSQPIYSPVSSPMASRFVYPSGFIGPDEFARIASRNEHIDDYQNTPSYDPECEPVKQCLCAVVARELLTKELLQFCSHLDALTVAVCEQTRDTHLFFEFWRNKHDHRGLEVVRRCFPELEYMLML